MGTTHEPRRKSCDADPAAPPHSFSNSSALSTVTD
eukprot:CAMPEP_0183333046 /NCGR_PEP_ID=MMETSP0164_2-20130417/2045_1 /TAXON_ID=221442 /ORGANISM="Coccolithus pelagicus ssp braarudi, Strain PLY182g" /LENGTH=34 /DNA_ID= /DNA_START= /DNA_END= /DNA_ORIENTATION=